MPIDICYNTANTSMSFASFKDRAFNKTLHFLGTIQEPWYSWINALANLVIRLRKPERITHPGILYPEKTFYIIDDLSPYVGLAGWYDRVLGYMLRAKGKGWTPIVVPCLPAQADDGDWAAFFNGPTPEIPIAEALQGRNVVHATPQGMIHKRYNRKNIAMRHPLCAEVPLSAEAQAFVDSRLKPLFENMPSPRVAIRFRGTDYRSSGNYCPSGHAKVPDIDMFCDTVEADMKRWNVPVGEGESIFVVTEEKEALDAIRKRFPRCRFVEKERFSNFKFGQYLNFHRLPTLTPKENNLMYLLEIYAMSQCDYLIGGVNGGVLMALNLNGNRYKAVDVLNTGVS